MLCVENLEFLRLDLNLGFRLGYAGRRPKFIFYSINLWWCACFSNKVGVVENVEITPKLLKSVTFSCYCTLYGSEIAIGIINLK